MYSSGFDEERIDLYRKGEHSDGDISYIDRVFSDDAHKEDMEKYLTRKWNELEFEDTDVKDKDLEKVLRNIHRVVGADEQRYHNFLKIAKWTYRIAAVVVTLVAINWGISNFSKKDASTTMQWIEINSPLQHLTHFTLEDGTSGWLNSGSKLSHRDDFINNREIFLEGEAFLDVAKDSCSKFTIVTDAGKVIVHGTKFNIVSYKTENSFEIALLEGEVLFESPEGKEYLMTEDDLLVYDKINCKTKVQRVQYPETHASWRYGELVFRNSSIEDVIVRLQRWYGVDFKFDSDQLCRSRLWATFTDESLEEVLSILKLSLGIDYEIIHSDLSDDVKHAESTYDIYDPIINTSVIISTK